MLYLVVGVVKSQIGHYYYHFAVQFKCVQQGCLYNHKILVLSSHCGAKPRLA